MKLKNYKVDLLKRLANPEYAAEYLARVLAEKDNAAFLIALKDVAEAGQPGRGLFRQAATLAWGNRIGARDGLPRPKPVIFLAL